MSRPRPPKRTTDDAGLSKTQPRPSKRSFTFPVASSHSEDHDRRKSEGDLLQSFGDLRLYTPPVETLPQEVLLKVFEHLVHPSLLTAGFPDKRVKHHSNDSHGEDLDSDGFGSAIDRKDLRNVCLVSRTFKMAATTLLYRCAHLTTAKSPGNLLSILMAHPELQPLVKHISIPTYADRSAGFDFAFSHDWLKFVKLEGDDMEFQYRKMSAKCAKIVEGSVLKGMVPLLPNLRTLVIPQLSFIDGWVIKGIVLKNLTTLRIALMAPPEDTFVSAGFETSLRTITELRPAVLGNHFPALQRLEVCTATNTWEASLISGEDDMDSCGLPLKFVESLKTTATSSIAPAEWHLLTLERPIFDSSKLHTLDFDGPGSRYTLPCSVASEMDWDLNRFLSESGGGLRTLSLDWEVHNHELDNTQSSYFGVLGHLKSLAELTNLTHLTVSLQALFGNTTTFRGWVRDMEDSADTELAKLFPPSLRTLRVAEYIPGVYEHDSYVEDTESDAVILAHGGSVYSFLQALRACWLLRGEGRELWFRRYADLDRLADRVGTHMGRAGLVWILDGTAEKDGMFERVLHPPEDMVWGTQWNASDDEYYEDEDGSEGSYEDSIEGEEDGYWDEEIWDQGSSGETVGVYQDGNFVLM